MANGTRKPMRQGQQNRRGRGRSRKVQNPLGRNLESNGPDVKIRGNAAHIAEKYATLARDALSSGDMVAGESYLQHAEHYFRIISAAQDQMQIQQIARAEQGDNRTFGDNGAVDAGAGQSQPIAVNEARGNAEQSAPSGENARSGEKKEARAPRQRRPRRPRISEKSAVEPAVAPDAAPDSVENSSVSSSGSDPAGAPQPDVGELPSFVTVHTKTSAAE